MNSRCFTVCDTQEKSSAEDIVGTGLNIACLNPCVAKFLVSDSEILSTLALGCRIMNASLKATERCRLAGCT